MTTRTIITTVIVLTFLGITSGIVIARHLPAHAKAAVSSVQPVHAPKPTTTAPVLSEVATDVNNERTQAGLAPLTEDARLDSAAQTHCDDMLAANVYSHDMPDGRTPQTYITNAVGYWHYSGENNTYNSTTASVAVRNWMLSSGHRANILDPHFTLVGYGLCKGTSYTAPGVWAHNPNLTTSGYLILQTFVGY